MARAPDIDCGPIRLTPFSERHFSDDYISWLNDPEVVRYSEQRHRLHDRESCSGYVVSFDSGPNLLWAIEIVESSAHIGNVSATFDINNRIADIGILIGASGLRGTGYGRLAWEGALNYLTQREDLRKVTGGCLEPNAAMVKIMRKCGMEEDGKRPDHFIFEGRAASLLFFSKMGKWQAGL